MNTKIPYALALAASVVLNAVLFAHKPAPEIRPAPASVAEKFPASPVASSPPATAPGVVVVTNKSGASFDWRQVESDDYKKYIANLRAIGCPERTIRDIITADVNELFKERERTSRASSTNKFAFWKTGMQMFAQAFDEEKIKAEQELRKEKRAPLTELLGSAPEEKPDLAAAAMGGAKLMEQMLDFLPSDKQSAVAEVLQKYQAKMMKDLGKSGFDVDSMKDITKIQCEMEAELAKTLSPQEMEDFNLRMSNTANMMRFQLASFEPDEQEFRNVFKLKKAFDDEFGFAGIAPTDKAEKEKFDAAKKELNAQLKQVLGDRYADYERAQDYTYQGLYAVSKEATVAAYDMKKAAEAEAKKIGNDKSLTAEQRKAALQGIQQETRNSLRTTFGDKAFESYQKNPGAYWLKGLAPEPKKL